MWGFLEKGDNVSFPITVVRSVGWGWGPTGLGGWAWEEPKNDTTTDQLDLFW